MHFFATSFEKHTRQTNKKCNNLRPTLRMQKMFLNSIHDKPKRKRTKCKIAISRFMQMSGKKGGGQGG